MVFSLVFSQNTEIKLSATGALISDPYNYCSSETLNLEVDDYASTTVGSSVTLPASTFNTIYNNTTGELPVPFNAAPSITEKFSLPINLDFNFKFFNKTYTRVVVGSNGRLLFSNDARLDDLNDTSNFIDRTLIAPLVLLPSPQYNRVYKTGDLTREIKMAQIFAGFTKLRINTGTGSYKYKKFDNGTNKGILITFQSVIRNNGSGRDFGQFTNRIILFDDGRVVLNVKEEVPGPLYNAILGMQNEDGDKEIIPGNPPNPIYNNGDWTNSGADAFVIKTGDIRTPTYSWELDRDGDGIPDAISTTRFFSGYKPVSDIEKLSVKITFLEPSNLPLTSSIIFKKIKTPQISAPDYSLGCGSPAKIEVISPDNTLTYDWYSETDPTFHQIGTSILVGNGSYYVQVNGTNGTCPLKSTSENVNISSVLPPFLFDNVNIKKCDNLEFPSQVFDLATVTNYPLDPSQYSVQFFENGSSTPDTTSTINSGQTKNYTITVSTNSGITPVCTFTKSFSVSYLSFPPNNKIYTSADLCLSSTSYSVTEFKNSFFASTTFQFLFSTDGVNFNLNSVNPQTHSSIWIKITEPNFTCQSIVKLNFNFHPQVEVKPYTPFPEHCNSTTEFFDLNITKTELEYLPEIKVTFYRDQVLTDEITNLQYRGSGKVYIKIENIITGCYANSVPELDLKIYPPPTLIKTTPETKYSLCGSTKFNLTTNINDYIGVWGHYSEIRYFDAAGTRLLQAEWEEYDLSVRNQPYMIFVYNETNNLQCSNRIEFNLIPLLKPVAIINQILICSETTYPLQEFKNQVATNPSQYTFTDVLGNPLPANFNLSSLPLTVNFLMKDNTTGCVSDPQTVTFVRGSNSVLIKNETDYVLCDADFDGKTEFNLKSKESDFTGSPATFEYFKDALFDQKIENSTKYVNENPFDETVYVKITVDGFCPSLGKIHLKANTPTKSTTLKDKYDICFDETLTINAGDENTIFVWSDGQSGQNATFTETGNYSVILKNGPDGCPYTHNFTISDENQPKIEVINQTNNSIEVIASGGTKPYRYYFNGIPQTSNILQNPTESSYEIQVESATGCFGPPKTIYFIKINNAFTPNGDGMNDTWKIENLDKMQEVSIVIINRNGTKVFESTNPSKSEWDGKSNGRELPTSSYWYVVTWFDAVTQKNEQRQGWILLKNRN